MQEWSQYFRLRRGHKFQVCPSLAFLSFPSLSIPFSFFPFPSDVISIFQEGDHTVRNLPPGLGLFAAFVQKSRKLLIGRSASILTSYPIFIYTCTFWFGFSHGTRLRRWKSTCTPNFEEIPQSTAEIKLLPVSKMDGRHTGIVLPVSILIYV